MESLLNCDAAGGLGHQRHRARTGKSVAALVQVCSAGGRLILGGWAQDASARDACHYNEDRAMREG